MIFRLIDLVRDYLERPPIRLGVDNKERAKLCAKTTVVAVITNDYGEQAIGHNECAEPQEKCPRLPGEGYEKCFTICKQLGHAEVQAIKMASSTLLSKPWDLHLYGHTYCCANCMERIHNEGVRNIFITPELPK